MQSGFYDIIKIQDSSACVEECNDKKKDFKRAYAKR